MKKKLKVMPAVVVMVITLVMLITVACGDEGGSDPFSGSDPLEEEEEVITPPAKTLTKIVVTTLPTKTIYMDNEPLNTAGMVVTAYYSDDTEETVTGFTTEGFSSSTAGEKTIIVRYGGKEASFMVMVYKLEPDINITFDMIAGDLPYIAGPTIHLIEGYGRPASQSITVTGGYESIKWRFNGQELTEPEVSGTNGETLTLSTSILETDSHDVIGKYFVTVEVSKENKFYSRAITFTVAP